jgi:hypothetical protein
MKVDCDFPGGNILFESIEGDTIHVRQDLRDTEGNWFWFYFRVQGANGRRITVDLAKKIIGVRGPAYTFDGGKNWDWLGAAAVTNYTSFICDVPADAADVRFAFGIPYIEANLKSFLTKTQSKYLKRDVLCQSRKGREVELFHLGCFENPKHRVLLTARHHACESTPSFVLEGVIEYLLGNNPETIAVMDRVEFLVVPFMDKDGVEDGDQGKNRKPYDHNRDYAENSIYPEVIALKEKVVTWSDGKLHLSMDLHCPAMRGYRNEEIYFVGGRNEEIWKRVGQFSELLASVQQNSLKHRPQDNLPFGEGWNNYVGPLKSCSRWLGEHPGIYMATTLEIPYANVLGSTVTPDSARQFGHDLARAIEAHFQKI